MPTSGKEFGSISQICFQIVRKETYTFPSPVAKHSLNLQNKTIRKRTLSRNFLQRSTTLLDGPLKRRNQPSRAI
ncbi:hypothetical protein CDAR_104871 [Caerostris darwini]|uniref:Uncharacterized protein n=1 Tax=Caerostris darwini TaxID=1538125 RepID=A0AAV4W667_9ARAC|nr:hypothetical protein CDAR_104871 [Caerostris darwini]